MAYGRLVRSFVRDLVNALNAGMDVTPVALRCNEIGDMEVRYEDARLEKLCTDEREMRRKRSDIADKLRLRIQALETAASVGELASHDPLGNWHPMRANLDGLWAGKLSPNYRLMVRPDGSAKASEAVVVTVIEICDYH